MCRVRDRRVLTTALTVDPLYLQHHHSDKAIDFRVNSVYFSSKASAFHGVWSVVALGNPLESSFPVSEAVVRHSNVRCGGSAEVHTRGMFCFTHAIKRYCVKQNKKIANEMKSFELEKRPKRQISRSAHDWRTSCLSYKF